MFAVSALFIGKVFFIYAKEITGKMDKESRAITGPALKTYKG